MSKDLYLPELKEIRKQLRKNMTVSERCLWKYLRKKQLGYKFRRQTSIGHFVVDFYCKDLNLAIEIDGSVHDNSLVKEKDIIRQEILESCGVIFLRFNNKDVLKNISETVDKIKNVCCEIRKSKSPPCGEMS